MVASAIRAGNAVIRQLKAELGAQIIAKCFDIVRPSSIWT